MVTFPTSVFPDKIRITSFLSCSINNSCDCIRPSQTVVVSRSHFAYLLGTHQENKRPVNEKFLAMLTPLWFIVVQILVGVARVATQENFILPPPEHEEKVSRAFKH